MIMHQDQIPPPLLNYTITTDPSPIDLGVEAKIIITVDTDKSVACQWISFEVPLGDDASDMYVVSPTPTYEEPDNTDWGPSSVPAPFQGNKNSKTFLFLHESEDEIVDTPVTFILKGTVNNAAGIATIQIKESSSKITDSNYMNREKPQEINKSAMEAFYLNSVVVRYSDAEEPVALIDKGRRIQLQWQSNGDSFKVYSGSGPAPVHTTTDKFYEMPGGLQSDTAYIIEAIKEGKYLYQEYVVKVSKPVGDFSELTTNSIVAQTGTFNSTINAPGKSNLASATVGNLSINQSADFSQAMINLFSNATVLINGKTVSYTDYKATSDGYIIAIVGSANTGTPRINNNDVIIAMIKYDGQSYFVSSATTVPDSYERNTATVPIRKDTTFTVFSYSLHGLPSVVDTIFLWVGLGKGIPTKAS